MSESTYTIERLDAPTAETLLPQFVALLQDAVESGASLGFWAPLDDDPAQAYWRDVFAEVRAGQRLLLGALRDGALLGSVQLAPSPKQNAPQRAEVQRLMVHRAYRRQGIGQALMRAVEREALDAGRTLIVLDTNTGSDAERLYRSLGYRELGVIPDYTIGPDSAGYASTFFYKSLATEQ
jgi:ribosomal protein S18 acetylase RimI-like enzyme